MPHVTVPARHPIEPKDAHRTHDVIRRDRIPQVNIPRIARCDVAYQYEFPNNTHHIDVCHHTDRVIARQKDSTAHGVMCVRHNKSTNRTGHEHPIVAVAVLCFNEPVMRIIALGAPPNNAHLLDQNYLLTQNSLRQNTVKSTSPITARNSVVNLRFLRRDSRAVAVP